MATYFFNTIDGERTAKDLEGSFFADVEAAASEARESAREWALQIIASGEKIADQVMELMDEGGHVRLSLPLRLVIT